MLFTEPDAVVAVVVLIDDALAVEAAVEVKAVGAIEGDDEDDEDVVAVVDRPLMLAEEEEGEAETVDEDDSIASIGAPFGPNG